MKWSEQKEAAAYGLVSYSTKLNLKFVDVTTFWKTNETSEMQINILMLFSVAKMPNESGTHKKIDCCHVKQNT